MEGQEAKKAANRPLAIGPIKIVKGPETLASVLRESIFSGALAEGASLAPERALVQQTGLSRATVREALRILEAEGLVVSRPGRNGGSKVQPLNGDAVTKAVQGLVHGQRIGGDALREAREIIEGAAARFAAERRTKRDLADIAEISARLEVAIGDLPRLIEQNAAWHLAIARAGHNPLLVAFMNSISAAISHPDRGDGRELSQEGQTDLVKAHRRVVEAIEAGDADAAERRMLRHLRAYDEAPRGRKPKAAR